MSHLRLRSYSFMPPSRLPETRMAALVATAPEDWGRTVVMPEGGGTLLVEVEVRVESVVVLEVLVLVVVVFDVVGAGLPPV